MGWQVGDQLQGGKYEITDVLGDGSFGTVYKAKFVQIDRVVVISSRCISSLNWRNKKEMRTLSTSLFCQANLPT
jgi:serine/threonine protein kinase